MQSGTSTSKAEPKGSPARTPCSICLTRPSWTRGAGGVGCSGVSITLGGWGAHQLLQDG